LPVDPLVLQSLGIAYEVEPKVVSVMAGSPAAEVKIEPGDIVTKIQFLAPKKDPKTEKAKADKDDRKAKDEPEKKDTEIFELNETGPLWPYFVLGQFTSGDPTMKVKLWIDHKGEKREVELFPTLAKLEDGSDWTIPERGLNFVPVTLIQVASSFGEALQLGSAETIDNLLMVYRFLQRIGQKRISIKMMSGPVGIAQAAGMKVKEGFASFLLFLTMLSANLAVVNFLPIPVLDGGHMVFLAYEGIRGKPASERVVIAFTYAGLIFLLTLMLFVLSLDLGWISRR
jgi:regulator of sigma E protease